MEGENEAARGLDLAEPDLGVERSHFSPGGCLTWGTEEQVGADRARAYEATSTWFTGGHGTILAIGSSIMSEAPTSFSSGISLLMDSFGTTVSTA